MEGSYGNNNSSRSGSVLKELNRNVSPINPLRDNNNHNQFFIGGGRFHHQSKISRLDPYASAVDKFNLENLDSTLIRYLKSGSPVPADSAGDILRSPAVNSSKYRQMIGHQYLSGSSSSSGGSGFGSRGSSSSLSPHSGKETPQVVFNAPVKVEEDVLVMDGILVGSVPGGGRARSTASSDSGGGSSSSSGSNMNFYKSEICRSWEDSSRCRYGSKCQFAHGKEEVRPTRFPNKNKSEKCKCYITGPGSCLYGSKCRFVHHQGRTAPSSTEPAVTGVSPAKTQTISPIKPESSSDSSDSNNGNGKKSNTSSSSRSRVKNTDWSPLDDGIVVVLPDSTNKTPSREAVDAYINGVLYGPSRGKRLPVFAEICPEE